MAALVPPPRTTTERRLRLRLGAWWLDSMPAAYAAVVDQALHRAVAAAVVMLLFQMPQRSDPAAAPYLPGMYCRYRSTQIMMTTSGRSRATALGSRPPPDDRL